MKLTRVQTKSMQANLQWQDLPTELRQDLAKININHIVNIEQKLKDRRRTNVLSYLHLCALRLSNDQVLLANYRKTIDNLADMREYVALLENSHKNNT